jgi:hypothetical protein
MQVLGVTGFVRLRNVLLAVVETDDMAGETFCQKQSAGALSAGNIEDLAFASAACPVSP